jgi:hypothetical protein
MKQAAGMDKEQKAQIAADHAQQMEAWQAETDRIAAQNKANIGEWKQQAKQRSADDKQATAVTTGNMVKVLMGDELYRLLPVTVRAKLAIAGGAGYVVKRILSNPATARVFMTAVKSAGDPAIYSAVINSMLREQMGGGNANSR